MIPPLHSFFFFNDTATTEIYTLSLHDALPIFRPHGVPDRRGAELHHARPGGPAHARDVALLLDRTAGLRPLRRSEEHTSELQSHVNLVCRLLLEKKKKQENRCFYARLQHRRQS